MKKTLVVLFAGLFLFTGSLSAATNHVTKSEMARIEKAAKAYLAATDKYTQKCEKIDDLKVLEKATGVLIHTLENDESIKDAPPRMKEILDELTVRMKRFHKFVQDAPNWKGSEAEWGKKYENLLGHAAQKEKELGEYVSSCKVKKWRLPIFAYILIGSVVIAGLNKVFKRGKTAKNT